MVLWGGTTMCRVKSARAGTSGGSAVTLCGLAVRDVIPVMPGWRSPNRISACTISLSATFGEGSRH